MSHIAPNKKPAKIGLWKAFKESLSLYKNFTRWSLIIGAGLLYTALYSMAKPVAYKFIYDDAIVNHNLTLLMLIIGTLIVGSIIKMLTNVRIKTLAGEVGAGIMNDFTRKIFKKVLPSSAGNQPIKNEKILTYFSRDLTLIEESIIRVTPDILLHILQITFAFIIIYSLSWKLAILTTLLLPFALFFPRKFHKNAIKHSEQWSKNEDGILKIIEENLLLRIIIKTFRLSKHQLNKLSPMLSSRNDSVTAVNKYRALTVETILLTFSLSSLLILLFGAYLVMTSSLSMGSLIAFVAVFTKLNSDVKKVSEHYPPMVVAADSMQRVKKFLQKSPQETQEDIKQVTAEKSDRFIEFNNVSFSHNPNLPTCTDINFSLDKGMCLAIIGKSGSGKSTLIHLLARLNNIQSGNIYLDGTHLNTWSDDALYSKMSVVFQDNILFDTTIRENIGIGKLNATDEDIYRAAELAKVHKHILSLPKGYDTIAGHLGERFSMGQRQRIVLARAIIKDPEILLLDEPTSSLDTNTAHAVNKTIKELRQGRTVIHVTHQLRYIKDIDKIIVMDHGRIAEQGTHHELLTKGGIYADLWRRQSALATRPSQVDKAFLKRIDLFKDLDDSTLSKLNQYFTIELAKPGTNIIEEGVIGEKLYMISRGTADVYITKNEEETLIATLEEGDFFGEAALIANKPRNATVRAHTYCDLLSLQRDNFYDIAAKVPELMRKIQKISAERES